MTGLLEQQNAQRDEAKAKIQRATKESLRAKKRRQEEFSLMIDDEPRSFLMRAIGSKQYDKLVDECPATMEQLANGISVDDAKFGPELLARVCIEPEMTVADWTEIWSAPEWGRGEISTIYQRALSLCNKGLELAPTDAG